MSGLAKASLTELTVGSDPQPIEKTAIKVQFNPTTLRIQMANNVDAGATTGKQVTQHISTRSATLTLDLVFDTADEGSTAQPVDVRDKTRTVARFIISTIKDGKLAAPPKVRFHWGTIVFDGVMTTFTEDLDFFSAEGTPLRAKVSIGIREQNTKLEHPVTGQTDRDGGALGTSGSGSADRTGVAIGGETAADFAARMGLDPSAWRGLSGGLDASLSLQAGLEIDFAADLSVSAGIGVSAGFEVGASASLEASFGLEASAGGSLAAGAAASTAEKRAAGMALSAAGGVSAAVETVQIIRAEAAAAKARAAFDAPARDPLLAAGSSTPHPKRPDQPRDPLKSRPDALIVSHTAGHAAPRPPQADPRATSFGFGVPLRPRAGAAMVRTGSAQDPERGADGPRSRRQSQCPCGCAGPCRRRGGRRI